jgi:molybdopterin synthase sulfur carrier subunit
MKLLYFAWLRSRIGYATEELPLPAGVTDVRGLIAHLKMMSPGHAAALQDLSVVRVAVNQDYVGLDHPVHENDEVALFPPVTGG